MPERTSTRKVRVGTVISDAMDKTIVVNVETRERHPLYGKIVKRSKKYTVHDEENSSQVGDVVRIMETRPVSKTKRWRLVEIVERAR
jgi:small subunit ribosomal protein S17